MSSPVLDLEGLVVGRRDEFAELRAAVDEAGRAGGGFTLLSGTPGVGKSTLMHALGAEVSGRNCVFAYGRYQDGVAAPYSALGVALGSLVRSMEATGTAERDRWRADLVSEMSALTGILEALVPELAQVLGAAVPMADLDAADARRRLQRAAIRLLSTTASYRTVVLAIDDLQWADRASQPHPLDLSGANSLGSPAFRVHPLAGGQPMTTPSPTDYAQQLLAYLQAWRQYLEQTKGVMTPSQPAPPAPGGMPATPPAAPFAPPPMPAAASMPMATPSTDYTQQLLAYLQAWRHYLEQTMGALVPGQSYPMYTATPPPVPPAAAAAPGPPYSTTPPPAATTWVEPPRPTTSALTPQTPETVVPEHPWLSHLSLPRDPHHQGGAFSEPISGSGSLYRPTSCFPSGPVAEYQPNSAYSGAAHSAAPGAGVPAAPESLYSVLAEPAAPVTKEDTHPAQKGGAVSGARPEELELVRPLKDPSR